MQSNGFMGMLYYFSEWVMRLSITNLLWIFFNLPIVYLVINLFFEESLNEFVALGMTAIALVPFLLFPATTSMFAVIRKCVMKEQDVPIIRSFWRFYKKNYLRSMLGGLIIGVMWFIYAVDYYYFTVHVSGALRYFLLIICVYLIAFTLHFISDTVHFNTKLLGSLKNTMFVTFGHPFLSLGIGIVSVVIIYLSINTFTFLIPFFMGSLIALVSFLGFYKVYLRVQLLREGQ